MLKIIFVSFRPVYFTKLVNANTSYVRLLLLMLTITVKNLSTEFAMKYESAVISCNKKLINLHHSLKTEIIIVNGMYTGFVMKFHTNPEF